MQPTAVVSGDARRPEAHTADNAPVLMSNSRFGHKPDRTDGAIANVTVNGIAGYLFEEGSHKKGPRDCPNYFNPRRELS